MSVDYNHIGLSSSAYLNHPLRVANLAISEVPNPCFELLATSLLHNLKELSEDSFLSLSNLPVAITHAITLLTVDRRNDTTEYKNSYYAQLYSKPYIAQVKILDKFLATISKLSFPCLPVNVLAFFVLTINPLINFL